MSSFIYVEEKKNGNVHTASFSSPSTVCISPHFNAHFPSSLKTNALHNKKEYVASLEKQLTEANETIAGMRVKVYELDNLVSLSYIPVADLTERVAQLEAQLTHLHHEHDLTKGRETVLQEETTGLRLQLDEARKLELELQALRDELSKQGALLQEREQERDKAVNDLQVSLGVSCVYMMVKYFPLSLEPISLQAVLFQDDNFKTLSTVCVSFHACDSCTR